MAPVDDADVMALAGALSVGEPEDEVERLAREAVERTGADDPEVRGAALRLILTDPLMREHFGALEAYLERAEEDEYRDLALPLAGEAALAAANVDLERALHEAGLYVDSYPREALVIGHLPERASAWLAERLTLTEDVAAARPRMRRAVAAYADAAAEDFPRSAAGLHALLAEPAPDDPLEDDLWQAFAQRIVGRKLIDLA